MITEIDQLVFAFGGDRSNVIRELVRQGLERQKKAKVTRPAFGAHKGAVKAKAMAGGQVERMIDPATPQEERQQRKRRLIKGPSEFREMRADLPKGKPGR